MKALFIISAVIGLAGVSSKLDRTKAIPVVDIVGTDYAFRVPPVMKPGEVILRFKNAGKHSHELSVYLLKPGFTTEQSVGALKEKKSQMPMVEGSVGVLFADPGTTSQAGLTVNLLPGRDYGIQCIFTDSTGKPRHYELGMFSTLHVARGNVVASRIPVDSIIAVDYAFAKYPRDMSPGLHNLAFRNTGKHRHEFNISLLKKGVTLDSVVAVDKREGDVGPLFDTAGPGAVLWSNAGDSALGFVSIDFLPGREYLIDCSFQDDDKSPPHYKLGMYGSIKARD
jgi:hypothetical protein